MLYARINLAKTNYQHMSNARYLHSAVNIENMNRIYKKYCDYKKFKSVMPIFDSEWRDTNNDVHGYYDLDDSTKLIAFSLMRKYDNDNVEAIQFAWNYERPKLQLGIKSLEHECAFYKAAGFKYLYLGGADEYKRKIDGFEIL